MGAHPVCVGLGVLEGVREAVGQGDWVGLPVGMVDMDEAGESLPLEEGLEDTEGQEDIPPLPVDADEVVGWEDALARKLSNREGVGQSDAVLAGDTLTVTLPEALPLELPDGWEVPTVSAVCTERNERGGSTVTVPPPPTVTVLHFEGGAVGLTPGLCVALASETLLRPLLLAPPD